MATTKTRILTATFPDGSTWEKKIKVSRSTSCDYDFGAAYIYNGAWFMDGLSRYREVIEAEVKDKQSRGVTAAVVELKSVTI